MAREEGSRASQQSRGVNSKEKRRERVGENGERQKGKKGATKKETRKKKCWQTYLLVASRGQLGRLRMAEGGRENTSWPLFARFPHSGGLQEVLVQSS